MKSAQELREIAEAKNKSTEIKTALAPALEAAAHKGKFDITFITNGDRMIESDLEEITNLGYQIKWVEEEKGYTVSW